MSSLRARLTLLIAVVLIPSVAGVLLLTQRERTLRVAIARDAAMGYVDRGITLQTEAVRDAERIMLAVASLTGVRFGDSEACTRTLRTLRGVIEEGFSVSRIRADGMLDCATNPSARLPVDLSSNATFLAIRDSRTPLLGSYIKSRETGEWLLPLNVPLENAEGEFDGVISTGLRLRWFDDLAQQVTFVDNATLTLSNEHGTIVRRVPAGDYETQTYAAHPIVAAQRREDRGVIDTIGLDGVRRLYAFSRLPSPDTARAFITVGFPTDAVFMAANKATRASLVVLFAWLVLLSLVAWWAIERFVLRDVQALLLATDKVGAGDFSARTGLAPHGEIGQLAVAFDGMAYRLEERRAREAQAQKLESIGQLAGGVAHDFNNQLTAIISNAESVSDVLPPDHEARPDLDEVLRAAERSAALTRQLLAFARRSTITPRVVSLETVLADVTSLLRRLIGEHIALEMDCEPGEHTVEIDVAAVEQAIVNLAVNARDAMPNGGHLVIALRSITVTDGDADHQHGVPPGEWVALTVRDTGTGMTEVVRARVFEPFFTTKPVGEGTGLGLAMVYGTVAQHQGHVWIATALGHGSAVRMLFPPSSASPEATSATVPVAAPARAERQLILLVEDEPAVRDVLQRVLTRHGYRVLTAGDGVEALQQATDGVLASVDCLVCDVVMPRMGGAELVATLRQRRPDLPVLFVSGYQETGVIDALLATPNTSFLEKPCPTARLLSAVHTRIHERVSSTAM